MLNMQCRLCSSSTALISLFSGKCRRNRDYIRKLIAITTGIEFQRNDAYKCICFACTIQIYNFYIFRTQSIENEKTLQMCTENNEKSRHHKIDTLNIDDIVLPDVEELKENLTPWFISKQKYCEPESSESDLSKITSDGSAQNNVQVSETSDQPNLVQHTETATQYEIHSLDANTQTDQASDININNCSVKKLHKLTQCEYVCVENCTQTEGSRFESKEFSAELCSNQCSKKIQCELCTCKKEIKSSNLIFPTTRSTRKSQEIVQKNHSLIVSDKNRYNIEKRMSSTCRCDVPKVEVDTQTDIDGELVNIKQSCENNFNFATIAVDKTNNSDLHINDNKSELKKILNKDKNRINHKSKAAKTLNNVKSIIQQYKTKKSVKSNNTLKNHKKFSRKLVVKCEESATQTDITCMVNADSKDFIKLTASNMSLEKNKKNVCVESWTQTDVKHGGNISVGSVNKEIQCNLPNIQGVATRRSLPSFTNTTLCRIKKSTKNITAKCMDSNTQIVGSTEHKTKDSFTQTDVREKICIENCDKDTQCELYTFQTHKTRELLKANTGKSQDRLLNKYTETFIESAIQTEISCMASLMSDSPFINPREADISKTLHIGIKHEVETSPPLSPGKCLSINVDGNKPELISPGLDYASPRSSNLLTIKDKIQHVIICPVCDTTVYSNSEYKFHKKSHMQCNFCKKKFRSLKRTKLHVNFYCEAKKLVNMVPVVTLVRLESLTDIQNKYPECIEYLKRFHKSQKRDEIKDVKKGIRIRSKSVSDSDSVTNCTACRGCISVLNKVSIGVDKSIQVNFMFDTNSWLPLKCVNKDPGMKRNLMDTSNVGSLLKKIKLSPPVNS